mgnify:CR=1 FL=1
MKETYEEIKSMYVYEQNRFRDIENKTASFLTLNSILFTLLISLLRSLYFIPPILFLILSIIFSFQVFGLKKVKRPHKKYGDFYKYAKLKKGSLFDKFLLNYIESINREEEVNKIKTKYLESIIVFSMFAWITFIIGICLYVF